MAAVRALTAPRRATRRARMASTGPVRVFGVPLACPDRAARAAAIASIGSDLPLVRRVLRSGHPPRRSDPRRGGAAGGPTPMSGAPPAYAEGVASPPSSRRTSSVRRGIDSPSRPPAPTTSGGGMGCGSAPNSRARGPPATVSRWNRPVDVDRPVRARSTYQPRQPRPVAAAPVEAPGPEPLVGSPRRVASATNQTDQLRRLARARPPAGARRRRRAPAPPAAAVPATPGRRPDPRPDGTHAPPPVTGKHHRETHVADRPVEPDAPPGADGRGRSAGGSRRDAVGCVVCASGAGGRGWVRG